MMVKGQLCTLFVILLQYLQPISSQNSTDDVNMSTLLDKIFKDYDKKLSPKYKNAINDQVVEVTSNIFVISMFSISEIDMDYSLSMFLRERWKDERLAYDDVLNLTRLELDSSLFDAIWVPDLFIVTEKFSDFHEVTIPNKMVHIYPDGTVQYSARVTGSFFCVMDLRKYPFDTQHCKMEFESYGQTTKNLKFRWDDVSLTIGQDIKFPEFDLIKTQTYNCDKEYFGSMSQRRFVLYFASLVSVSLGQASNRAQYVTSLVIGQQRPDSQKVHHEIVAFPCIGLKFILERNYAYHIIQIYVPSILIVILSWVNFWLDCTSVPGRVSLALLTVLTMTTQSAGARSNLPRVSYIKAIDVWMAVCLAFVFLGLLEFAYVNVQSRVLSRRKSLYMIRDPGLPNGKSSNGEVSGSNESHDDSGGTKCSPCFNHLKGLEKARAVDKISRVVFPLSFIIFNLVYWIYYFTWNPDFKEGQEF